jgi:hypothetical protein
MDGKRPDEELMALMELHEPDPSSPERLHIYRAGFGRRDRRRPPRDGGELGGVGASASL